MVHMRFYFLPTLWNFHLRYKHPLYPSAPVTRTSLGDRFEPLPNFPNKIEKKPSLSRSIPSSSAKGTYSIEVQNLQAETLAAPWPHGLILSLFNVFSLYPRPNQLISSICLPSFSVGDLSTWFVVSPSPVRVYSSKKAPKPRHSVLFSINRIKDQYTTMSRYINSTKTLVM